VGEIWSKGKGKTRMLEGNGNRKIRGCRRMNTREISYAKRGCQGKDVTGAAGGPYPSFYEGRDGGGSRRLKWGIERGGSGHLFLIESNKRPDRGAGSTQTLARSRRVT